MCPLFGVALLLMGVNHIELLDIAIGGRLPSRWEIASLRSGGKIQCDVAVIVADSLQTLTDVPSMALSVASFAKLAAAGNRAAMKESCVTGKVAVAHACGASPGWPLIIMRPRQSLAVFVLREIVCRQLRQCHPGAFVTRFETFRH